MSDTYPPFGFALHHLLESESIENLLVSRRQSREWVLRACACDITEWVDAISTLNRALHETDRTRLH